MSVKCTRDKQNEDSSFSVIVYPRVLGLLLPRQCQPEPGQRMLPAHACPAPATCATNIHPAPVLALWSPRSGGTVAQRKEQRHPSLAVLTLGNAAGTEQWGGREQKHVGALGKRACTGCPGT